MTHSAGPEYLGQTADAHAATFAACGADGLQVAKMVGSTVSCLHEDALGSVRLEATTVTVKFSPNYSRMTPISC